jgi:hypothetical protein
MRKQITLLAAMLALVLLHFYSSAQISGTVFRDFNANGVKDNNATYNETFVAGVSVKAFNAANVQLGTTKITNASGTYSFTVGEIPAATAVRIEFSGLATGDFSSTNGAGNGSNVQFVTSPSAVTNFAVNAPDDYWDNATDPYLLLSVQQKGQRAGDAANRFSLLQLRNSTSGVPTSAANVVTVDTSKRTALHNQTGTTWGIGYQKRYDRYFAAASLKRIGDLGQYGLGGVYFTSKSASDYVYSGGFNLNGVTPANGGGVLNFGTITRTFSNTISDNNLASTIGNAQSRDMDAFTKVDKMSFGGIDFDGSTNNLYMLNLFQKRLVVFDASATNATLSGASAATLAPFTLAYDLASLPGWPAAAGAGDNIRPWALSFHHSKGYIGVVSDASTTQAIANLKGYILQFDPQNIAAGFTTVLTIDFDKYGPATGLYQFGPWLDTWPTAAGAAGMGNFATNNSTGFTEYPQPVISDINFNEDGSMDISIKDRFGDQAGGYLELLPISGNANFKESAIRGDLLHACLVGSTWITEGISGSCVQTLANSASTTGPVGTRWSYNNTGNEYYADYSGDTRAENALGSTAKLMGSQRIVSAVMDPMDDGVTAGANHFFTAGLQWNNVLTGLKTQNARINYGGPLAGSDGHGKSNCLGDIEFATPEQPLQVGNRIWVDANGNGIQDAGETTAGVPTGTTVTLRSPGVDGIYGNGDDQTWTTTTNATGNYYFSTLSSADNRKPATWIGVGNTILPGYEYRIEVAVPGGFQITKVNVASNGVDNIDNDASLSGTNAIVTFNTGNTNHNFDIGFKPLASLGDKVWRDDNKNGSQDAGEPGLAGITVTLKDNAGVVLGTTVTDAYGNYLFDNLAVASYTVTFTLPANYSFTTQTNTTDDNNTTGASTTGSDANAVTGQTYTIVLSAGENNRNIDAGMIFNTPTASNSLGDRVWFDTNNNGVQDAGEPGVAGVVVTLYASNGTTVIATTVTDANGNYSFTNLPASTDYIIGMLPPAGMVFTITAGTTTGNATTNSDVNATLGSATYGKSAIVNTGAAGTQITGIDAGVVPQANNSASLGDRVWNDLNSNGTQDAGEPGIAGVTVNLYEDANGDDVLSGAELVPVRTAITDVFGNYIFNNLVITSTNKWQLEFVQPSGYVNTPVVNNNSGNDATDSDIINNATDRTAFMRLKFNERNTKTDAGFVQSAPAGALRLGDKVWRDDNSDGQQGATEPGVAGVTVRLYQNGTDGLPGTADDVLIATQTTDVNGSYLFISLAASAGASTNYNVQFSNVPSGFSFTLQNSGAAATDNDANELGKTGSINLLADNLTIDGGIKQGTASGKASIGNKVWVDVTGGTANVQDANEPGVAGVTVRLYRDVNGDGIISGAELTAIATTTTNALGEYIFDNLDAGVYQLGFSTLPAGYTLVTKDAGTDDNLDSDGNPLNTAVSGNPATAGTSYTGLIALATGEDKLSVDLGLTAPALTNTIGNFIWYDTNSDGLQAGEQGISGVTVTLYNNAGTAIGTTVTNINGEYLFTGLADGTYSVGVSDLPDGFEITSKSATNDLTGSDADIISGRTATVVLNYLAGGTNRDNRSLDAGLISTRAALGNRVWDDLNGDGVQDAGEPSVAGITVTLYAADGTTVLSSAITDQNGNYLFANLTAGTYVVGFSSLPANVEFTQQNTPGDNGNNTNNDAIPATGKTGQVVLSAGETDLTIDAGIRRTPIATVGNRVWDDINGNGLQDAGEPGIAGVIATLYNNLSQPISSAVTDGNGLWLITNVPVGTGYYVIFSNKPLGNFTIQDNGGAGTGGGTDTDTDSDANAGGQTGAFDVTANTINVKIDAGITYSLVLPVKLINFTAQPQGSNVLLNWVVTDEINVTGYTIEFSTNGTSFNSTGNVAATNSRNYSFVHTAPVIGLNYYRLRSVDRNGDISYSDIRKVNFGKTGNVLVYPSPATDFTNITLTAAMINKPVVISLIAMDGKVVLQQKIAIASQTETINLQNVANGKYIISIITGNEVISKKIEVIR